MPLSTKSTWFSLTREWNTYETCWAASDRLKCAAWNHSSTANWRKSEPVKSRFSQLIATFALSARVSISTRVLFCRLPSSCPLIETSSSLVKCSQRLHCSDMSLTFRSCFQTMPLKRSIYFGFSSAELRWPSPDHSKTRRKPKPRLYRGKVDWKWTTTRSIGTLKSRKVRLRRKISLKTSTCSLMVGIKLPLLGALVLENLRFYYQF